MAPSGARKRASHIVREAVAEDVETLVRHRHLMFEDIRPRKPEEHVAGDRIFRSWLKKMMRERQVAFFVASNGEGEIVASGGVWLRERQPHLADRAGPTPYVLSMYTVPAYRAKGYATSILEKAEEWCRKRGFAIMSLHASEMGRPLYSSLGWERTWEMEKKLGADERPKGGRSRPRQS